MQIYEHWNCLKLNIFFFHWVISFVDLLLINFLRLYFSIFLFFFSRFLLILFCNVFQWFWFGISYSVICLGRFRSGFRSPHPGNFNNQIFYLAMSFESLFFVVFPAGCDGCDGSWEPGSGVIFGSSIFFKASFMASCKALQLTVAPETESIPRSLQ